MSSSDIYTSEAEHRRAGAEPFPLLGVLIVNYGSHRLLRDHLPALLEATTNAVAVVVDNRTDDAEREAVTALALEHGWHLETPEENLGFGAGMNLAVERARGLGAHHLLLLNPDVVLEPRELAVLRHELVEHPSAMITPIVVHPEGFAFHGAVLDLATGRMRPQDSTVEVRQCAKQSGMRPWLTGACLMLDIRLWTACGGFDEEYFLYWEDVDLSHRVCAVGGELRVVSDVRVIHEEGSTSRSEQVTDRAKSDTYYYYNIRNRLLYARKHLPARTQWRWAALAFLAAHDILMQGGKRQFLHSMRPVVTAIRGTYDGLLILAGPGRAGARHD